MKRNGVVRAGVALVLILLFGAAQGLRAEEEARPPRAKEELEKRVPEPKKPLTLEFRNEKLLAILDRISEEAGLNIVISQAVAELAGPVTGILVKTPAEEALRIVVTAAGLKLADIPQTAGIYVIVPAGENSLLGERAVAMQKEQAETEGRDQIMERMRDWRNRMEQQRPRGGDGNNPRGRERNPQEGDGNAPPPAEGGNQQRQVF